MGKQGNSTTDYRLDKIEGDLQEVKLELKGISSSIKTLRLVLGVLGTVFVVIVLPVFLYAASAWTESIARRTVREEIGYRTKLQAGKLSNGNSLYGGAPVKTSTQPIATRQFRWALNEPVNPSKVIDVRARARKLPPGVTITCDIDDDGKACIFTLTGPQDAIESLDLPIAATAIIDVAS
jgi:hypothetical protein